MFSIHVYCVMPWLTETAFFPSVSVLFDRVFGFFPETAWRFNPYRQAAHQW